MLAYEKFIQKALLKCYYCYCIIQFPRYFKHCNTMSSNKLKRINTVIKQLQTIHEELFGQKYSIGLTLDEKSEFKKIIEEFRELIHIIRSAQQQRQRKQNQKNYKNTPDKVRINFQIRQDIEKAESILKQAAKRLKNGQIDQKVLQNRERNLKNCYQLLQDVKQCQEGGIYKPPEYPTLQQIKLELTGRDNRFSNQSEQINMDEQVAFDKFDDKDKQIDGVMDEIINANKVVREKMKNANVAIDQTHERIKKANKKAGKLITRVEKADKDLAEILKTYQRPSQLCLNITLLLMVLGLVAVVINLIKGQVV